MARTAAEARDWVAHGEELCRGAIAGLGADESAWEQPSQLPGWTRKHLVAHLAANADAVGNLVHWARTGERTPMYSSPDQRSADIESGATRDGADLARWFDASAATLSSSMDELSEDDWSHEVVTAQGRTVPASETPWMRAREVCVHAVDLGTGVTFADLPADFLSALVTDITAKRGEVPQVQGSLPDVAAYLAGRGTSGVTTPDGSPPPDLGPWL